MELLKIAFEAFFFLPYTISRVQLNNHKNKQQQNKQINATSFQNEGHQERMPQPSKITQPE